jgi:hypothetical protein
MERYENAYLGLLDLNFTRFVTEGILKILYLITVVLAAATTVTVIIYLFTSYGLAQGIGALIIGPVVFFLVVVLIRVFFEVFIVIFRIADYLRQIAENTTPSNQE